MCFTWAVHVEKRCQADKPKTSRLIFVDKIIHLVQRVRRLERALLVRSFDGFFDSANEILRKQFSDHTIRLLKVWQAC